LTESEGLVSDMLNYKKGFSKETIRILSAHFKTSQEAFNRTYPLKNAAKTGIKRGNKISRTRKIAMA
jgi:HTH-type transcriptional regulator/antitoxin HigA